MSVVNLVLYHLVSGAGWFTCGVYFVGVTLLDAARFFDARPRYRRVAHFFMVLAIPLAAMTGTPMRIWLAALLVVAVCGHAAFAFTNKNLALRRISAALSSKRILAGVVLNRRYTGSDGLHLSQSGHARFAEIIRPWLGIGAPLAI